MRPQVILNCAMSLDGCIGLPGPRPLSISGPADRKRVHELRASCDAILVGIGTVLADDPKLTVKWELLGRKPGNGPLRVVLDARLRTPASAQVLSKAAASLIFHAKDARGGPAGTERHVVATDADGNLDLGVVLDALGGRGIRRLMVEGGSRVLGSFLAARLADEFRVYVAPMTVGLPDAPRVVTGDGARPLGLRLHAATPIDDGVLLEWARGP